jgi:uroporphyrinogen decarboxylase
LAVLNHREPDRLPFDLGGTVATGMHVAAYRNLRRYLGMAEKPIRTEQVHSQLARLDDDLLDRLGVDTRFIGRRSTTPEFIHPHDEGEYLVYEDEWGNGWRMPKDGGLYFDVFRHPFDVEDPEARLKSYRWPDECSPWRFELLRMQAELARLQGKATVLLGMCAGMIEQYALLRGYIRYYTDLGADTHNAEFFLDKMLEMKAAFWDEALSRAGDLIDVVNESDDLAGQQSMLISPKTYRTLIKPRHQELFARIKRAAPHAKLFLHSCGAIRSIIPDLIEIGVEILNPVQLGAQGMDGAELKREFGKDLVFWGGGIDTQKTLVTGTRHQIRDEVRRNIETLSQGGGYVFAAQHVIQADVPPENFMTMWEAWMEMAA